MDSLARLISSDPSRACSHFAEQVGSRALIPRVEATETVSPASEVRWEKRDGSAGCRA